MAGGIIRNANDKKLITGTRYLNVEGMLPFEERVANYIESTGNHVLYRVPLIFEENNLVASGVLMEAKSVEDGGNGICFCSYCYNVQPGITIDYATGDSQVDEIVTTTKNGDYVEANEQSSEEADPQSITYIANKNTKVFHYPDCPGVGQMKEKNKIYSEKTRDELIVEGYKPCGNCHP